MGEAPDATILVQDVGRGGGPRAPGRHQVAYITQTTLSVDETSRSSASSGGGSPRSTRRGRRTSVRDLQPAVGRQGDARRDRPAARDRLAELVESNRLVDVARASGVAGHLIDDETEIDERWLEGVRTVGISSGASAPERLVDTTLRLVPGARRRANRAVPDGGGGRHVQASGRAPARAHPRRDARLGLGRGSGPGLTPRLRLEAPQHPQRPRRAGAGRSRQRPPRRPDRSPHASGHCRGRSARGSRRLRTRCASSARERRRRPPRTRAPTRLLRSARAGAAAPLRRRRTPQAREAPARRAGRRKRPREQERGRGGEIRHEDGCPTGDRRSTEHAQHDHRRAHTEVEPFDGAGDTIERNVDRELTRDLSWSADLPEHPQEGILLPRCRPRRRGTAWARVRGSRRSRRWPRRAARAYAADAASAGLQSAPARGRCRTCGSQSLPDVRTQARASGQSRRRRLASAAAASAISERPRNGASLSGWDVPADQRRREKRREDDREHRVAAPPEIPTKHPGQRQEPGGDKGRVHQDDPHTGGPRRRRRARR